MVIIPGTHNHAMDASLPELGAPGTPLWQRFGSKMLIDATIPPPADAAARAKFERIRPHNPQLRLEDFAAESSLPLVRACRRCFSGRNFWVNDEPVKIGAIIKSTLDTRGRLKCGNGGFARLHCC